MVSTFLRFKEYYFIVFIMSFFHVLKNAYILFLTKTIITGCYDRYSFLPEYNNWIYYIAKTIIYVRSNTSIVI